MQRRRSKLLPAQRILLQSVSRFKCRSSPFCIYVQFSHTACFYQGYRHKRRESRVSSFFQEQIGWIRR
ncbi:hypothetical protein SUGI_0798310 [Cryptomeria japonica]|nr:hypothetical protein SUGI_0798310 [Cryptomeria japonica]